MLTLRRMPLLVLLLLLPVGAAAGAQTVVLVDAARNGDVTAIRALLQERGDVNEAEPGGTTALHWASHRGDLAAVDLLLRAGARPTASTVLGITPLSLAVANGNAGVVDRLLKSGANPNTSVNGGETVLMTAARAGRTEALRLLLEGGANVNAREETRGQTALMWAASEGHVDGVRLLMQHGADIKAVSHPPSSPGDVTDGASLWSRAAPRVDIFTPLQFAVRAGHVDAAVALLKAGASLADETPQGMGLLTLAIANTHYEMAAFLIERGADLNAAKVGWTPLHQAVRMRTMTIGEFPAPRSSGPLTSFDIATMLLAHGVVIDARTTKWFTDGVGRGRMGAGATALLLAAKGADVQMMSLLVANGSNVTATNASGTTALMAAAGIEMSNPNTDSGTDADSLEALKLAIALGAGNINAVNKAGETALHGAVFRATTRNVELLVEHGAKLDVVSKRGTMPIDDALNGIPKANNSRTHPKPVAAKVLHEAMVAQGLPSPGFEIDKSRYNYGVKVADAE